MNIKPTQDRVIIQAAAVEETTKSGIILPDTMNKEKSEQGEVVAVGPGRTLDNGQKAEMSVKIGDKVIFKKYSAEEIMIDDKEYLIVEECDVLAIL